MVEPGEPIVAGESWPDPTVVAAEAVARVLRLLRSDGAVVACWDPEQRALIPLALDDPQMTKPDPIYHPGQGMLGMAYASGEPVVADDYAADVPSAPFWARVASGVAVPLRAGGEVLGAVCAQQYEPRVFGAAEVAALEEIAADFGPTLGTMGTLARAQRRTAEALALADLMRSGAALRDEEALAQLISDYAARLLGADLAGVVMRGAQASGSAWIGLVGNRTDAWRGRSYDSDHPASEVIFSARTEVRHEPGGATADKYPFFAAEGIHSAIVVPLAVDGPPVGALAIGWRFPLDEAETHVRLAEALGGFAAALLGAHRALDEQRALVANAPVVLLAADPSGIITSLEGAGAAELGLGPDAIGRRADDVLAEAPEVVQGLAAVAGAASSRPIEMGFRLSGHSFDARLVPRESGTFLVATDVTARRAAEMELERLAREDLLTGLPNLAEVRRRVDATLARDDVSLGVANLRAFDHVNQTVGFDGGDRLLVDLGRRLAQEIADAVVVGRTGGDEFTVATLGRDAAALGARMQRCLETLVTRPGETSIALDVRLGIATMAAGGDGVELRRHADAALQQARRGAGPLVLWNEEAAHHHRSQIDLAADVRHALDASAFDVAYQPIVDARTGEVRCVEALARWMRPNGDRVPPSTFIGIAERLGRIDQLTRFVLDRAIVDISATHDLQVNVNVSPVHLDEGDLQAVVDGSLAAHAVDPGLLCLEVTESAELESGSDVLHDLAGAGVRVAVDDFGSGWSSLDLLHRLPAAQLKLDRSYVARVARGNGESAIVSAAVFLGHSFGMEIIAEGVEDDDTLHAVRDLGCDCAQGYLVARPMPAHELAQWLATRPGARRSAGS